MASELPVVLALDLPGVPLFRRGKVREVFDLGDQLLLVSTDRVSAFDVILNEGIPGKGTVLNQLSKFWFDKLSSIVPNHCVSIDPADFPASLRAHEATLRGRSMLCRKAELVPFECVVRGYLAGSGYKDYQKTGAVCGVPLKPGLRLADRLPRPIFTPATKAETGHDENVSLEHVASAIGDKLAERLRDVSLALYNTAATYALERGIVIADTKFEFGLRDGELMLIDEALTPDSSRFWRSGGFEPGTSPPSWDKQIIRDYLESTTWNKQPPPPPIPPAILAAAAARYQEILTILRPSHS